MKRIPLSRRCVLRGGAGVAVSLPFLEAMTGNRAQAAPTVPPKRYLLGYAGCSLGGSTGSITNTLVPSTVGANYELKSALSNLAPVRDQVTLVTGLKIPWGSTPPAGGRKLQFHYNSMQPLLTGMRGEFSTPTTEHLAADLLGATTFSPLVIRVQASGYVGSAPPGSGTDLSYRLVNGNLRAVPPRYSPQQTFQALFSQLNAGGLTPEEAAQQQWLLKNRKSILDSVRERYAALGQRLGAADKRRLDEHLQEVRELEVRVSAIPPAESAICLKPGDPGVDPPVGGSQTTSDNGNITYQQNLGYSNEEQRARAMCDLVHMAYACDLTRSTFFQFTNVQCFLNMLQLTGQKSDLHELSHGSFGNRTEASDTDAMAKGINWHMKHWAYLIGKLANTKEGTTSILDNMAACFVFEGGQGYDTDSGAAMGPHTTEGMAALVSGGVGGLKRGVHLRAPDVHPARVLLTALRALGSSSTTLGEVSDEVPGLR